MAKKQISFWPLCIEFASVVFAVLLAPGLNSDNIKSSTLIKTSHYFTRNAHEAGKQLATANEEILTSHQEK